VSHETAEKACLTANGDVKSIPVNEGAKVLAKEDSGYSGDQQQKQKSQVVTKKEGEEVELEDKEEGKRKKKKKKKQEMSLAEAEVRFTKRYGHTMASKESGEVSDEEGFFLGFWFKHD